MPDASEPNPSKPNQRFLIPAVLNHGTSVSHNAASWARYWKESFATQWVPHCYPYYVTSLWLNLKSKHWQWLALNQICLRYVNDTFVRWNHGMDKLTNFLSHLNNQNSAIQFTIDVGNQRSLTIWMWKLDMMIKNLRLTVHRKKHTQTSIYMHNPNIQWRPRLLLWTAW